ncbi:hypothetical protein H8356DRAFT_950228, partial [Neocallimastix lanati (nom. inval.)]
NYNVILNKKNYNVCLSRLDASLTSINLKGYIDNDVIEQLERRNPNHKPKIKKAKMQDSKAQMLIYNTIIKQNTRPDDPIDLDSISRKYKGVIKQNNELLIKKTSL